MDIKKHQIEEPTLPLQMKYHNIGKIWKRFFCFIISSQWWKCELIHFKSVLYCYLYVSNFQNLTQKLKDILLPFWLIP